MSSKNQIIKELIEPIFDRMHVHLIDIDLRGKPNNQVLSIYADTEMGITMQEITDLTREIEDVLDIQDPIPGKYRLEVSSPGVKRPLKEAWQFRKNLGRKLRVLFETDEGKKDYIGTLKDVDDNAIILQLKKKDITIPFHQIEKAILQLKW